MINILKSTGYSIALSAALLFTGCAADGSDSASDEGSEELAQPSAESAPAATELSTEEELADEDLSDSEKGLRDQRYCWLYMPGGNKACRYLGSVTKAGGHIRCAGWVAAAPGIFYKYSLHEGRCSDVTGG